MLKTNQKNELYQYSTMAALVGGVFGGTITFEELLKHGDHGIGTLDNFDGELIIINGEAYQVRQDGKAYKKSPHETTPYASISYFQPDFSFKIEGGATQKEIEEIISSKSVGPNVFYAVKIQGTFKYVDTRVVPKQKRPYPLLVEAVKNQPTYHFDYISGTMVGFWTPPFIQGIGVTGYHIHFLDKDEQVGGHVYGYEMIEGIIEVAQQKNLDLVMPNSEEYYHTDLCNPDMVEHIELAER
ncbi:acetolactate decarboxylase [Bacillus sp. 03113]|uniref:acetolactate decarboxylase n=1 Tax=Bacillus sp. 03113 TaxID=2578211 RepID=UPI00114448DD|nr:acetolactate decarboxylase [Bacillus sp. 03113]